MTLLAVSFAFGLATLGAALAVSARSYLASAASRERAILDRISLESAATQVLDDIAVRNERPLKSDELRELRINGRVIVAVTFVPEAKIDLGMDDGEAVTAALSGLARELPVQGTPFVNLKTWSGTLGLSAAEEDCLRSRATLGRAPELMDSSLIEVDGPRATALSAGDQIETRVYLASLGTGRALWQRSRFIGQGGRWVAHDYAMLRGVSLSPCS